MSKEKLNLNQLVTVKLTPHGIGILAEHYRALGLSYPTQSQSLTPNAEGEITLELHRLANIFGSFLSMGNPNDPFQDMNVELSDL
jgi:hypothetical protein